MKVCAEFFDGTKKQIFGESWAECLCHINSQEEISGAYLGVVKDANLVVTPFQKEKRNQFMRKNISQESHEESL